MDFEKPVCVSVFVNNAMACWDLAEVWERSNPPGAGKHSLPQHTHKHTHRQCCRCCENWTKEQRVSQLWEKRRRPKPGHVIPSLSLKPPPQWLSFFSDVLVTCADEKQRCHVVIRESFHILMCTLMCPPSSVLVFFFRRLALFISDGTD